MTIFLVRHAHAGSRSRWSGDDALRPLSDRGHEQANGLVEVIGDAPIGAILSSPYVRCMETVVPLAAARSVAIEPTTVLAEGADFPGVLALIAKHADTGAVLCTHGDIIPSVLAALARRGVAVDPGARSPKGCTWVLRTDATGEVTKVRYVAPPAATDVDDDDS
ncbi:MAG: SixA phosphatase family protein [Actinomycetota bacterium]